MDSSELAQLLSQEEGPKLDFKREYELHHSDSKVRKAKWNEFIKDVLALTNGNVGTVSETGYLIIGADDTLRSDGTRELFDVRKQGLKLSPQQIIEKVNAYCHPPIPNLFYFEVEIEGTWLAVIEIPPGTGPGTVNDAFFRFVTDTGPPGPDKGKGGKYLILPPDYDGELDPPVGGMEAEVDGETYFVSKSTSWINWFIARGFLKDGKPDFSSKLFRDGIKIYPLAKKDNPPAMEFYNGSTKAFNTIHSTDFDFYKELHAVIDREPVEMLDPELRGLFASVGIQKGKPFDPDLRMKNILIKSAEVGNATARTMLWYERNPEELLYEGSNWKRGYPGGSYEFLKDDGEGGRNLDARSMFYYFATVNTPAMAWKLIGKGSQYAWGALDADGDYLDGSKTYRLNLPKDAPAKQFISIVLYDPQTRSQLQTSQPFPSYNSEKHKGKVAVNEDGSVDLYFGPEAPEGKEENWIETVPGKGFFAILRLYSPTEPWFEKTWRPGDIELVE